jgi:hypothetical protein
LKNPVVADYWAEITAVYKSLPDYLTTTEKWEVSYARMRELKIQETTLPTIPQGGNVFVREYAMAIRAMMVFRFSHLVVAKDFIKGWE